MKSKYLILLFSLSVSTLFAQFPTLGLMVYYPLDGDAKDSWTGKHHGTESNIEKAVDRFGKPDAAVGFKGLSNSYISLPNTQISNNNYTYSMWVKNDEDIPMGEFSYALSIGASSSYHGIKISNQAATENGWTSISYNNTAPSLYTTTEGKTFSKGTWHHVACSRGKTYLKLFVDGVQVDSSGSVDSTAPFYGVGQLKVFLGMRHDQTEAFKGAIDDVLIYNRALSFQEIRNLYHHQLLSIKQKAEIKNLFIVYPNPAQSIFHVKMDGIESNTLVDVELIDISGKSVYSSQLAYDSQDLEIKHSLGSGLYLLKLTLVADNRVYSTPVSIY